MYDDLAVAVADDAELSYAVFPVLDGDQSYAATFVAVDLLFDDGSTLSGSGATDDYGFGTDAAEQGAANKLWPDQWNRVSVDLAEFSGRTVNEIRFTYDHPGDGVSGIEPPTVLTPRFRAGSTTSGSPPPPSGTRATDWSPTSTRGAEPTRPAASPAATTFPPPPCRTGSTSSPR